MLILIDGYNVIAPAAPPGRRAGRARRGVSGSVSSPAEHWLHAERMRLLERLARQLDPDLASKTHVIFDAAAGNLHGPDSLLIHGIHVRFAVSHDEADDLIEELIAAHHSPKRLTVVSSDHRLQVAARRAGAKAFDAQPWLDALLDGRVMLAMSWPPRAGRGQPEAPELQRAKPDRVNPGEVEQWMREFEISADDLQRLPADDPHVSRGKSSPAASSAPPQPPTGQGRGRGRTGGRPAKSPASQPPASQPMDSQPPANKRGRRHVKKAQPPQQDLPSDYNPFPKGYGEDLLGDAAEE